MKQLLIGMMHRKLFIGLSFLLSLLIGGCGLLNGDESENGFGLEKPSYPNTFWEPSVSADGEIIVFHRTKVTQLDASGAFQIDHDSTGIWMVRPAGTGFQFLLQGDLHTPTISPDGQWLAYEAGAHIFKAPFDGQMVDTTGIVQLTREGRNFSPAWSPDGEWIAYDRSIADQIGPAGVWIMKPDGSGKKDVFGGAFPNWHPDGQSLLGVIGISSSTIWKRIIRYYPFENELPDTLDTAVGNNNRYPKYSPDGSKIVFQSQKEGEAGKIWVMNSNGSDPKPIAERAGYPTWTPDGRIVYVHGPPRFWDNIVKDYMAIWIMNADGSGKRQLTYNHGMQWTQ